MSAMVERASSAARAAIHAEPVRKARNSVAAALGAFIGIYLYSLVKEIRRRRR